MGLSDIRNPESVLKAIREYDRIGQDAFLKKYGFGKARDYFLWHDGKPYYSKAIAGVAHRYEFSTEGPLRASDFSGGEATVAHKLRALGFEVRRMGKAKNPPWSRDELILALDLYFRHPPQHISKTHPEIVELSRVLNALPIHSHRPDATRFRNSNAVYMKLCNFLRFDSTYAGKGLQAGSSLEEKVWNEFADDQRRLAETAAAIRDQADQGRIEESPKITIDDEEEFPEGRILFRAHRSRERNHRLVERAKQIAFKKEGRLACQACGFDFHDTYGALGKGFIESHHILPISEIRSSVRTKVSDLALLCSNCHRMVHRQRPWLSMKDLSSILSVVRPTLS